MKTKSYSEMQGFFTFKERYDYLKLNGSVGESTFGFDRYLNQQFYRSSTWRHLRNEIIARDGGCDLGIEGYDIHDRVVIHHITPMTPEQIQDGHPLVLDPDNLITTTHETHNAIHFGDDNLLRKPYKERRPGDTKPW